MNNNAKAVIGIFGIILISTQALYASELGTVGNLTETSVKISSINMEKNPTEAVKIFSSFYSGSTATGNPAQSTPVYFDAKPRQRPAEQDIKSLCNAEPNKATKLGKKVPPLTEPSGNIPEERRPFFWHGPNPNPQNDPVIQQGLENGVNNYCANNPNAPACNPENPYSPYHDPNSEPETGSQTYGANYYWHNRHKEAEGINPDTFISNGK